jgi:hypothetical protein
MNAKFTSLQQLGLKPDMVFIAALIYVNEWNP